MESSFKVLPKKSASPSIVILKTEQPQFILKVWSDDNKELGAQSLMYEIMVYEKIKELLKHDSTLPFLKMKGRAKDITVKHLGDLIGVKTYADVVRWNKIFYVFFKKRNTAFSYSDAGMLKYEKEHPIMGHEYRVDDRKLNAIILPFVVYKPFKSILNETLDTNLIQNLLVQIITGIRAMYNAGIVHNDLHYNNIMVDENNKVMIFDWDRGYVSGLDNPSLSVDRCGYNLCSMSQCNIHKSNGYATDLYKILHYVAKTRILDFDVVLNTVFNINTRENNMSIVYDIREFLCRDPNFRKDDCTYLQYPDDDMKKVASYFGTINEIHAHLNPEEKENGIVEHAVYSQLVDNVVKEVKEATGVKEATESKASLGFDQTASRTPLSRKILLRSKKLVNIHPKKATYGNLIALRRLYNRILYGRVIKTRSKTLKGSKKREQPVPIYELMEQNDVRKYGKGKSIV